MVEKTVIVKNPLGIHARPSGCIVGIATKYHQARIMLFYNGQKADAKSIMDIMMLAMVEGAEVRVEVEGHDDKWVLDAICKALIDIYEYSDD